MEDATNPDPESDILDKLGEIVCVDVDNPDRLFYNENGESLRATYIAKNGLVANTTTTDPS